MPYITVGADKLYYATRGMETAHPPIVLMHGAGSSHLIWNGQLAALAQVTRAFGLDLPGHNRSEGAGRRSVAEYAEVVRGWLDAVGLERAVLAGHSMGGAICQTVALAAPERTAGLALVGTGARLRVLPEFLNGILADFQTTAEQINRNLFAPDAPAGLVADALAELRACAPQVVHDDYAACDAFDVMREVGEIRAPTIVLCGKQDRMTPVKYSEFLAARIPGAELVVVEGAGHNVMLEQPAAVNVALVEWLRRLRA